MITHDQSSNNLRHVITNPCLLEDRSMDGRRCVKPGFSLSSYKDIEKDRDDEFNILRAGQNSSSWGDQGDQEPQDLRLW